jgi:hypothetical protein
VVRGAYRAFRWFRFGSKGDRMKFHILYISEIGRFNVGPDRRLVFISISRRADQNLGHCGKDEAGGDQGRWVPEWFEGRIAHLDGSVLVLRVIE